MDRRGFLGSILALGVAPAIVRADSLMRIVPRETVLIPAAWDLSGNGNHLYFSAAPVTEFVAFNTAHTEAERKLVQERLLKRHGHELARLDALGQLQPNVWYRFDDPQTVDG